MKIAFIVNHYKTVTWFKAVRNFHKKDFEIFWISVSSVWTKWLLKQNIERKYILDISYFVNEWVDNHSINEHEINALNYLEKLTNLNINNIILMDRLLRLKPAAYAYKYLYIVQRESKKFLSKNQIKVVFCEITWAHELVIAQVCKNLGILVLSPHTVRIPDGRFAFFKGFFQEKIFEIRKPESSDFDWAEKFLKKFRIKKLKPRYYYLNNKTPKFYLDWFKKLVKHIILDKSEQRDESKPNYKWLVKKRLCELINYYYIIINYPFEKNSHIAKRPFVLFALHVQPEASIDVLGAFYSNQIETIKTIARTLPITHDLYVKEHSNAIGSRSIFYYNKLKRIPRVKLIDPFMDSFELIQKSDLVISISGTIAYEAALMGKPAITIAPMFFGPILLKNGFNPYSESISDILEKSKKHPITDKKIIKFLAWIFAQSFKGNPSDVKSDLTVLSDENLLNLSKAFYCILKKV